MTFSYQCEREYNPQKNALHRNLFLKFTKNYFLKMYQKKFKTRIEKDAKLFFKNVPKKFGIEKDKKLFFKNVSKKSELFFKNVSKKKVNSLKYFEN